MQWLMSNLPALLCIFRTFTDHACQSIHTQKLRHLYYQPEEDFWIIMVAYLCIMEYLSPKKESCCQYLKISEILIKESMFCDAATFEQFVGSLYIICSHNISMSSLATEFSWCLCMYVVWGPKLWGGAGQTPVWELNSW